MISFILPLIGRFHPILVHLPIGFLLFGIFLNFRSKDPDSSYQKVVQQAFLLGAIGGILACMSGFLQYQYEGFSWETVRLHLILGLLTTLGGFYLYVKSKKASNPRLMKARSAGLGVLLLVTGHLGGTITHGETYLIEVLPDSLQAIFGGNTARPAPLMLPEPGWESVMYYDQVVQPILQYNCQSCHNPRNQKGGLDLSSKEGLLKGGESGAVLDPKGGVLSPLLSRMQLPLEEEDHMPPKEKRQPKKEEIQLISHWLEHAASFDLKLGETNPEFNWLEPFFEQVEPHFYPTTTLEAVHPDSLLKLRKQGFYVEPIAQKEVLLKLSCINFPEFRDKDLQDIYSIKMQLVYLDLSGTEVTDAILEQLIEFPNLTVLKLNETKLSGRSLGSLMACKNLKSLFLNGTRVAGSDLRKLASHPSLERVFAYDTEVTSQESFDQVTFRVETGGYSLPLIPSDTLVY